MDELVATANQILPCLLPEDRTNAKLNEEVNPRLVRNLGTLGLIDEPLREGRESRYMYRHLLQLLVTRRLMAQGYTTGAVKKLVANSEDEELEAVLEGAARLTVSYSPGPSGGYSPSGYARLDESQASFAEPAAPAPAAMSAPVAPVEEAATSAPNAALRYLQKIRAGEKPAAGEKPLARGAAVSVPTPSGPAALSVAPAQYVRVAVQPGLELHVSEEFEIPPSAHERDKLLEQILTELKRINDARGGKKRRTR